MDKDYIDVSYDEDRGLRLADAFKAIGRHMLACLVGGALVGALFLWYTATRIPPTYQSSFTVYVSNRPASQTEDAGNTAADYAVVDDANVSNSLASTYAFAFKSGEMVAEAARDADLGAYTDPALAGEVVSTQVEQKAPLVTVTVTADSPQDAYQLAQSLVKIAPDYMVAIMNGSSMSVVEPPHEATHQSSPSNVRNAAIGFLVGFLSMALIVVVRDERNPGVGGRKELEERSGMPVITDANDVLPLLPRHISRIIGVMDVGGTDSAARNALAIATSCAKEGERTLLLDCDAQNASCSKMLGVSRSVVGLAGLLAGEVSVADTTQRLEGRNICFIAPGEPGGDFMKGVRDGRMVAVLEELRADYDCIVAAIPSPLSSDSALMVADALGMVFLSIASKRTRQSAVAEVQRRLRLASIQITGFIYGSPRGHVGRLFSRRR